MKKRTYLNLILLFAIIFIAKAVISLLIKSPLILSDEACVAQKAIHFANSLTLESCGNILDIQIAKNPLPLYSILISPIYLFLKGTAAYYAALILNSLLISSLVFPLYSILKKFLKNNRAIFINIVLLLLLPQIVIFEKILSPEILFIVINIWFLRFYLNSFKEDENRVKNKLLAIMFSVLATLTVSIGTLVPIAMAINEISQSRNRKQVALIYLPLAIVLTTITAFILLPETLETLNLSIKSLERENGLISAAQAIRNQLNSFTIATFFIPLIIFFTYINKRDSNPLKAIKYFLLSFIALNFLLSIQYTFDQIFSGNDMAFNTRHINVSIIYVFLFTLIFLQKYKKFNFNKSNSIISIILVIPLFFLNSTAIENSANPDISIYYNVNPTSLIISLIIPYLGLLLLFAGNKRKILIGLITAIIVIQSIFSMIWTINSGSQSAPTIEYFKDKEAKILFLREHTDTNPINDNYWKLLVLSNNEIKHRTIIKTNLTEEELIDLKKEFDHVVTRFEMNPPLIESIDPYGTGSSQTEYIYE